MGRYDKDGGKKKVRKGNRGRRHGGWSIAGDTEHVGEKM